MVITNTIEGFQLKLKRTPFETFSFWKTTAVSEMMPSYKFFVVNQVVQ